jgi:Tripartite ATP-independent periplasmic transporters, DctQ component
VAKVERIATIVAQLCALIGLVLLIAFAVGTLGDGLLRRFAGRPIEAVRDIGGLVVAIAVVCCMPLALLQRANITIKFVQAFFGDRLGGYFDAVASVAIGIVLAFIARQFFIYALALARTGDTTTMLSIKTAPFWFVVSAVLWIATATQCVVIAQQMRSAAGRPVAG